MDHLPWQPLPPRDLSESPLLQTVHNAREETLNQERQRFEEARRRSEEAQQWREYLRVANVDPERIDLLIDLLLESDGDLYLFVCVLQSDIPTSVIRSWLDDESDALPAPRSAPDPPASLTRPEDIPSPDHSLSPVSRRALEAFERIISDVWPPTHPDEAGETTTPPPIPSAQGEWRQRLRQGRGDFGELVQKIRVLTQASMTLLDIANSLCPLEPAAIPQTGPPQVPSAIPPPAKTRGRKRDAEWRKWSLDDCIHIVSEGRRKARRYTENPSLQDIAEKTGYSQRTIERAAAIHSHTLKTLLPLLHD